MDDARTTIRLDKAVHKRLKILAAQRDTTIGKLIDQALRQFLAQATGRKGRTKEHDDARTRKSL